MAAVILPRDFDEGRMDADVTLVLFRHEVRGHLPMR